MINRINTTGDHWLKQRIKLSKWAKLNGYSYHGAFRLFKKGLIKNAIQTETGSIFVDAESNNVVNNKDEHTVVYARVSSTENKENLETQASRVVDFCAANGWVVNDVVKECASGVNDKRPKLNKILSKGKATRIVVEHKDRLTRFGFGYIETLFDGEIVVINEVEDATEDLMQDFISIITSFCARIYGQRRSKRKTEKIISAMNEQQDS